MALRAKKPTAIDGRAKILLFAPSGFGKTLFSCQWPRPYIIDTERGAERKQYADAIEAAGGVILQTDSLDEIIAEVNELTREKHEFRTLVIDPITVPYTIELDRSAQKNGTEYGRHKVEPDRKMKRLIAALIKLDMNVILTSHAKANWIAFKDAKGNEQRAQTGNTFDTFPKTDYMVDLVLEGMREHPSRDRRAKVVKSRLAAFPEDDVFDFSYRAFADRYGADILQREAVPVALVKPEDAEALRGLIRDAGVSQDAVAAWLKKAGVDEIDDMPADIAAKCIAHCRTLIASNKGV